MDTKQDAGFQKTTSTMGPIGEQVSSLRDEANLCTDACHRLVTKIQPILNREPSNPIPEGPDKEDCPSEIEEQLFHIEGIIRQIRDTLESVSEKVRF